MRLTGPKPERLHYGELAQALNVSTNTLRRWLRILKTAGLVTTTFVPGTHNAQTYFQIHLEQAPPHRPPAPRGPRRQRKKSEKRRSPRPSLKLNNKLGA
jgi:DNA-binding transcriptional ArsR family regulator